MIATIIMACLLVGVEVPTEAPSSQTIVRVLTAYAKELTFQQIERRGDYLDRLGRLLVGYRRCPEATVKRVCETIIVPTPDAPDGYGFEKGLICQLWLLLRHRPGSVNDVLSARTFRTFHVDIQPPIVSWRTRYAYDYPWIFKNEKWRLSPFEIGMDPMGIEPMGFYRIFSKLPLRAPVKEAPSPSLVHRYRICKHRRT